MCLRVCMYHVCVFVCEDSQRGRRRASDPLELELQVIVSHSMIFKINL